MRKTLLFGTLVAILTQSSVQAESLRGVTRIGNGRILVRHSQHTCSANDLAFWQSVVNQAGQAGQLFLINQNPAAPNPAGGQAGAQGNAAAPSSNDPTLTNAESNFQQALTNYATASQNAATAAAAPGPNQKALQVLNAQLTPLGQVQAAPFVTAPQSGALGVQGAAPQAGAAAPAALPTGFAAANVAVQQSAIATRQAANLKLAAERADKRSKALAEAHKMAATAEADAKAAAENAKKAAASHAAAAKAAKAAAALAQ